MDLKIRTKGYGQSYSNTISILGWMLFNNIKSGQWTTLKTSIIIKIYINILFFKVN
jgi:hypothetical protein